MFVIALDGQDNWFSAVDPTSDGFFYVNLSAAISNESIEQVFFLFKFIGIKIGGLSNIFTNF